MYFANFKDLKIQKEFKFITKNIYLEVHKHTPISKIKAEVEKKVKEVLDGPTDLPVLYDFTTAAADTEFAEYAELADFMLTLANVVIPVTLQALETGKGYKRERRLDVPDKLKPLKASFGTVKRACNHEILTQLMNIRITYNDTFFLFCDGKDIVLADDEEKKGDDSNEQITRVLY